MTGIMTAAAAVAVMCAFTGCALVGAADKKNKAPEKWYNETLQYYKTGFENGWKGVDPADYHLKTGASVKAYGPSGEIEPEVKEEYKNSADKFGYLLRDLDGDGTAEVLIGFDDGSAQTKFTEVCVWHSDFGAFNVMSAGDGYYMYLCNDNVLRVDSWYGSETRTEYMKYDHEGNSFIMVESDASLQPGKYELKSFSAVE